MLEDLQKTDVAIIGAGPVGIFAVFECGMVNLSCHVIDALAGPGGQCTALYPEKPIYDIPGYPAIMAGELIDKLLQQSEPFKPVYHYAQQVVRLEVSDDNRWMLETSTGTRIDAAAVVIAAGVGAFGPNRPPLAGIEQYEGHPPGHGVHYFISRREDYRDRNVVIAGGGDSAVDWAVSLAELAASVSVVHRRPKFRAAPDSARKMQELADSGMVDLIIPYQLHGLEGVGGELRTVVVSDLDGNHRRLRADVLLPFFGLSQNLGPILDWGLNVDRHHIIIEPGTSATDRQGIFAIGDIVSYPGKLKLILTGFAEAAAAAHAIYHLLHPDQALHFEHSTTKGVPGSS